MSSPTKRRLGPAGVRDTGRSHPISAPPWLRADYAAPSLRLIRFNAALSRDRPEARHQTRPWQCLYFFPEPHGHGALRGVRAHGAGVDAARAGAAADASAGSSRVSTPRAGAGVNP